RVLSCFLFHCPVSHRALHSFPTRRSSDLAQIPDVSYVVQRGDTLSGIAARFSTTVAELATINQLRDRHSIRIGQTLILPAQDGSDRKSTRLNSSHVKISYAVFCLKKKTQN